MITADAVIVGGGPAGSTAARQLTQLGADVLVLDKAQFPRNKVCAGWITPAIVKTLELDLESYSNQHTLQSISGFQTSVLGGNETHTGYEDTVSYGIRRSEFDHYLLQRSGARTITDFHVKAIARKQNGFVINNEIETPLLIGAGGHACPVSRFIGNRPGKHESVVSAQEIEFKLTPQQLSQCKVEGLRPELYFCRDLKGYAWVFRKGDYLNIGLGREDNHQLTKHIADFVHMLTAAGRIPADIPGRYAGHAYLLYGHSGRKAIDDGVLLMGDALGLAYPQSGEGIRPAIESAVLASTVIAGSQGVYNKGQLSAYEDRIKQRFGSVSSTQAQWMPARIKYWLARQIVANPWFARHVVIDKWFLHRAQPALPAAHA